jgi:hypothetical protein
MPVVCQSCHDSTGTCACQRTHPPSAKRVAVDANPLAAPASSDSGVLDAVGQKFALVTSSLQEALAGINSIQADLNTVTGRVGDLEQRADTSDQRLDAAERQLATVLRDMQQIQLRSRTVERSVEHLSQVQPDDPTLRPEWQTDNRPTNTGLLVISLTDPLPRTSLGFVASHVSDNVDAANWQWLGDAPNKPLKEHFIQMAGNPTLAADRVTKIISLQKISPMNYLKHETQAGGKTIQAFLNRDQNAASKRMDMISRKFRRVMHELHPNLKFYFHVLSTSEAVGQVGYDNLVRVRVDPTSKEVSFEWRAQALTDHSIVSADAEVNFSTKFRAPRALPVWED